MGIRIAEHANEAGEDIRYLERDRAETAGLPQEDYWLFDSCKLVIMRFDETDNRFLEAEVIEDPGMIAQHNHWRDVARHYAMTRDEFAAKYDPRSNSER